MPLILGIDPGSRVTGYGLLVDKGSRLAYVTSGVIRVKGETVAERLYQIHQGLQAIIAEYRPEQAAIEQVFLAHNAASALKLGQARGVAIVAMAQYGLNVAEYSARQVKQAVVGYGAADKKQVQVMVTRLLNLKNKLIADEADALAVALCHAHSGQGQFELLTWRRYRRGRYAY